MTTTMHCVRLCVCAPQICPCFSMFDAKTLKCSEEKAWGEKFVVHVRACVVPAKQRKVYKTTAEIKIKNTYTPYVL